MTRKVLCNEVERVYPVVKEGRSQSRGEKEREKKDINRPHFPARRRRTRLGFKTNYSWKEHPVNSREETPLGLSIRCLSNAILGMMSFLVVKQENWMSISFRLSVVLSSWRGFSFWRHCVDDARLLFCRQSVRLNAMTNNRINAIQWQRKEESAWRRSRQRNHEKTSRHDWRWEIFVLWHKNVFIICPQRLSQNSLRQQLPWKFTRQLKRDSSFTTTSFEEKVSNTSDKTTTTTRSQKIRFLFWSKVLCFVVVILVCLLSCQRRLSSQKERKCSVVKRESPSSYVTSSSRSLDSYNSHLSKQRRQSHCTK